MDAVVWGTALLGLLGYLYWRYTRCFRYWKDRGIPSVPLAFLIGFDPTFFFKPFHEVERKRYETLGRIYGAYEGTRPVLTCAEPECLRKILVKDFQYFPSRRDVSVGDPIGDNMLSALNGENWKRVRNLITPAFTTGKIKKMTSIILESAQTFCDNLEAFARNGQPADVKRLFGAFTMDVIASAAFATKVNSHNDPNNKFVEQARKIFNRETIPLRFILFFIMPKLFRLLRLSLFPKEPMHFFRDVTLKIIEERKKSGQVRNDFLQLMIEASEEQEKGTELENQSEHTTEPDKSSIPRSHKTLTENEVVAQSVLFFLAGYDTTASTMASAAYSLALNLDCQERLISEIDATIQEYGGELTYEGVRNMKFLDNVVSETMRIYSPAIRLERKAEDDYNLVDAGFVIPKGMIVGIPVYAMHQDPEFFPDPEKFDPDRFNADAKSDRHQFCYLPFGAGPRNCVAMRFALMEVKLCLARLFSQFRVKTCPQTKIPMQFNTGQGLLQPKDVFLSIEERIDSVYGKRTSGEIKE